ncbi:MAG TPA: sulfite oxidase [Thermodesulfobacteriota bacterium]
MPHRLERDLVDPQTYRLARTDEHLWREARALGLSRRRLLALAAAGAGLAGGLRPSRAAAGEAASPVVKAAPPELFNRYGSNLEMRWEQMYGRGYVVPNGLFFVRNHTKTPQIEAGTWTLTVDGSGVSRPLTLSYNDLLKLPSVSVLRYVECAGNGRSFFEQAYGKRAQGTQWKLGAVGVAEWTGVRLSEILDRAGVKPTARDVMPAGLDDLKVRRPMPIAKATADDTLVVYAMNGETLPPDHGFPARLLAPGWIGVQNVKWLGRIEVSDEPLFSPWNTDSYVLIGPDYQPQPPSKGPVLTSQNVKSALEFAWDARVAAGRYVLTGRAWAPARIAKVEVSVDRGPWRIASLGEPNIAGAWVRFRFDWDARPGRHAIRLRATDEAGNTQPDSVPWNDQGYLYNAVVEHPITVT